MSRNAGTFGAKLRRLRRINESQPCGYPGARTGATWVKLAFGETGGQELVNAQFWVDSDL